MFQTSQLICREINNDLERLAAFALRHQVFLRELKRVRDIETDADDEDAIHLILLAGREVIGTLRLYEHPAYPGYLKIGRVAVRQDLRGQGYGKILMETAHTCARKEEALGTVLHAECSRRAFYERLGYQAEGAIFEEAGLDHILMRLKF